MADGGHQESKSPQLEADSVVLLLQAALQTGTIAKALPMALDGICRLMPALGALLVVSQELAQQLELRPVAGLELPNQDERMIQAVGLCGISPLGEGIPQLSLPLLQNNEALGFVTVALGSELIGPTGLLIGQQLAASLGSLLVWARQQAEREQQAVRSARMLVQHVHQTRLAAINDLAAGLAHEINNPISAIVGLATLLQRDENIAPGVLEDLRSMTAEALRISELVNRLAHFGQAAITSKAPVAINTIISDTVAVMRGLLDQRGISRTLDMPTDSPLVLGSQAQLQQLCLDLLNNAIDAVETSDKPEIAIQVTQDERFVTIVITDNGIGIPEEYRERVFEPGFTTKSKHGTRRGLGVGLPMAQEIIRTHWGTLRLESTVWRGTSCILQFPTI